MGYLTYYSPKGFNLVRDVFIETGTYQGTTLAAAAKAGYKELHSVECLEEMYLKAVSLFADDPKVHLHLGSSPEVLPWIMDGTKATVFWLDAHYCGGTPADRPSSFDRGHGQCPLLDELKAIMKVAWRVPPYILVDDAKLFVRPDMALREPLVKEEWPTAEQIAAALPGFTLGEWGDIIYCLPGGECLGFPVPPGAPR